MKKLFSPLETKHITFKNKVVMAPLTRSRATAENVPTDIMATYYGNRAGAGLIITEGTSPSPNGVGYPRIPGIYNDDQVAAWKKVTDAVHHNNGKIFLQIMHTGRVTHPDNLPKNAEILAPSVTKLTDTKMYVDGRGELEIPEPKEMSTSDIEHVITEYMQAAKNAVKAGFDGVEIHGANGYLLEQFLNPVTNNRSDEYGGTIENRCQLILTIVEKTIAAIGAEKVGIRLSPNGALNEMQPFEEQGQQYDYLSKELNKLGLLYIHLVNHESMGAPALPTDIRNNIRQNFDGLLILSGGYDDERAEQDLQDDKGDLVAFGRPFIANPDLVERFKQGASLNDPRPDYFYTPGKEGYIDYPVLETAER